MKTDWVDGFTIRVRVDESGTVVLSANKEGLLSLSQQFAALAEQPTAAHIHYDAYNSLEDGSTEIIIEKVP
ncbi:MAG: hypothetical protein IJT41_03935 [Clostridia bacterium]|nr:hypothetical protein [Clostridia bacterium]